MAGRDRQGGDGYRALFERLAEAALVIDPESGAVLAANARARELYGLRGGASLSRLSDRPDEERRQLLRALRGPLGYEAVHRGEDGERFIAETSASPVDWRGVRAVVCLVREITGRRRMEMDLRRTERRYRSLVEETPGVVFYVDDAGGLEPRPYMSPYAEKMLGFSPEEWLADENLFLKLLHPEDRERVLTASVRSRMTGEPVEIEYRMISRDGRVVWVRDASAPVEEDGGVRWQGVMVELTALREERPFGEPPRDPLTGLPGREIFLDRLSRALLHRAGSGLPAVFHLDLDGFRLAGDALGEEGSGALLRAAGRRISSSVREMDTVARLGEDEFAVLIEDVRDAADAARLARKLEREIRHPFTVEGADVLLSASIGVSLGRTGVSPQEMLLEAEAASSGVKARGGAACGFFDAEEEARAFERLALESDLRLALDRGEVELLFRPRVSLRDGILRVVGAEAFPSWEHPEHGRLTPGELFEVAGTAGLEEDLRRMVLEEACRRAVLWAGRGATPFVGVALSGRMVPGLVGLLARLLQGGGLDPRTLVLQIPEAALVSAPNGMERSLAHLKRLGVGLEICGFGVGGLPLSHLGKLPADSVKIDRSLVEGLESDASCRAAVGSAVALARALEVEPVADGVERGGQVEALRVLGCTTLQGNLFAGLLPAWRLDEMLAPGGSR
ncbi:MAG: EAL domain-containing protein [Rubrobacteraceae bacterium]|nr:EAL domain-containing protein [Rubrobacteraceae bacterium]